MLALRKLSHYKEVYLERIALIRKCQRQARATMLIFLALAWTEQTLFKTFFLEQHLNNSFTMSDENGYIRSHSGHIIEKCGPRMVMPYLVFTPVRVL